MSENEEQAIAGTGITTATVRAEAKGGAPYVRVRGATEEEIHRAFKNHHVIESLRGTIDTQRDETKKLTARNAELEVRNAALAERGRRMEQLALAFKRVLDAHAEAMVLAKEYNRFVEGLEEEADE